MNSYCKKECLLLLLFLTIAPFVSFSQNFLKSREVQNLTDWDFLKGSEIPNRVAKYTSRGWEPVKVPHTWNAKDVLEKGFDMYKGHAWYRTTLNITRDAGKRYFLRFEGACIVADVYINNVLLGQHRGSYTAFVFELTDFLNSGKNTIEVKVDNSSQVDVAPSGPDLYPSLGGLYRPVKLFSTSKLCISPLDDASSGVYITTPDVNEKKASVSIRTLLNYKANGLKDEAFKQGSIETTIKNKEGVVVASANDKVGMLQHDSGKSVVSHLTVKDPVLWDAKRNPYLYTVTVSLKDENDKVIDQVTETLGIRSYRVDADKGFFLNGKSYRLYGSTRHQEWEGIGSALSDEHHRADMTYINQMGATILRLAHYPQADIMYRIADTTGMVVWAEIPVTPPYRFNYQPYIENTRQQLREMIKQLYNHPSIIFWGMQNESDIPAEDMSVLHQTAKKLDPYRLTTQGEHRKISDRNFITDLVAWNKYYGWYYGKYDDIITWKKGLKERFPNLKIGISEYGAGGSLAHQEENAKKPDAISGKFYPEQIQRSYHEESWRRMKDMEDLWCAIIWNTFDFVWETVDRGDRPFINHKGLITHDRKTKKDAFYFYKTQWNNEPILYLLDRRFVNRTKPNTVVGVYTNQRNPVLKINGKTIRGRQYDADLKKYTWPVTLSAGENNVEVQSGSGSRQMSDSCVWNLRQ